MTSLYVILALLAGLVGGYLTGFPRGKREREVLNDSAVREAQLES